MGKDYYAESIIGWEMSVKELLDFFGKLISEESHFEDRFDVKTGEKTNPVKVIDAEEGILLEYENIKEIIKKDYEKDGLRPMYDFFNELEKLNSFKKIFFIIPINFNSKIIFGIKMENYNKKEIYDRIHIGSNIEINDNFFLKINNSIKFLKEWTKKEIEYPKIITNFEIN